MPIFGFRLDPEPSFLNAHVIFSASIFEEGSLSPIFMEKMLPTYTTLFSFQFDFWPNFSGDQTCARI